MPITIWCNERSLEGECFLLPTFDQSNWRLLPAGGTRISSDFCKIINKRSVKEVLSKPCRFKMSRVILCKFGRFGELVKVFDKTTTNPITLPTPTNNSNSDFKNSISVSVEENCFWCLPQSGQSPCIAIIYIIIIIRSRDRLAAGARPQACDTSLDSICGHIWESEKKIWDLRAARPQCAKTFTLI